MWTYWVWSGIFSHLCMKHNMQTPNSIWVHIVHDVGKSLLSHSFPQVLTFSLSSVHVNYPECAGISSSLDNEPVGIRASSWERCKHSINNSKRVLVKVCIPTVKTVKTIHSSHPKEQTRENSDMLSKNSKIMFKKEPTNKQEQQKQAVLCTHTLFCRQDGNR